MRWIFPCTLFDNHLITESLLATLNRRRVERAKQTSVIVYTNTSLQCGRRLPRVVGWSYVGKTRAVSLHIDVYTFLSSGYILFGFVNFDMATTITSMVTTAKAIIARVHFRR